MIHSPAPINRTFRHAHMACGIGAGAKGFNMANPRVGNVQARFECAGGIDVDEGAIRNFERLTGAKGTVMDLFSLDQYEAFHGRTPPPGWVEASPADVYAAYGPAIDVAFASMPCKGFSGLLSAKQSVTDKYQALNALTLRGIWLLCEAYKDEPIPIILFENVPRIANRGRWLLDQICAILRSYNYNVAETVHDCGELGGLAQSRKRFLLIARQRERIPNFVYQPAKHKLRGVGEVIGKLPLPGDPVAGIMHRVPALFWKTWVRLAFVPAGKDWRALNELAVEGGVLSEFGIMPDLHGHSLGVCGWADTAPTIMSARAPGQGRFSVADPRALDAGWNNEALGVRSWRDPARVVAGSSRPANGAHSVADPRPGYGEDTHRHVLGVKSWDDTAATVSASPKPSTGAHSVADPRYATPGDRASRLGVQEWTEPSGVIAGEAHPTNGAYSVADPRVDGHERSVQLGVRPWDKPAGVVTGKMFAGGGPNSVADPRLGRVAHNNVFRIVAYDQPGGPAGGITVADPQPPQDDAYKKNKYRVTPYDEPTGSVIGASTTGTSAYSVADPRPAALNGAHRDGYATQGHYGVVDWTEPTGAVPAYAKNNNGPWSVADPREVALEAERFELPQPNEQLVCRIIALDGTWHRPFTTLDLTALQSIVDPEEIFYRDDEGAWHARTPFDLVSSTSDATKREWVGNAVPPKAAMGVAHVVGEALLLAEMGETFTLSTRDIWVRPAALALAVDTDQIAFRMDLQ